MEACEAALIPAWVAGMLLLALRPILLKPGRITSGIDPVVLVLPCFHELCEKQASCKAKDSYNKAF